MLATLMLAQGTPMLLAGDEIGNSQSGNNNAYAQDNEIGWVDWTAPDTGLRDFTAALIAFRKGHPILRQKRFLHARERAADGLPDLFWWREDGQEMGQADWAGCGPPPAVRGKAHGGGHATLRSLGSGRCSWCSTRWRGRRCKCRPPAAAGIGCCASTRAATAGRSRGPCRAA
jgi:hypothetical protein